MFGEYKDFKNRNYSRGIMYSTFAAKCPNQIPTNKWKTLRNKQWISENINLICT